MIPAIGIFLIYSAVVLRAAVVSSDAPYLNTVLGLLALYGLLLFVETGFLRAKPGKPALLAGIYCLLQAALVTSLLAVSAIEDFFALLFIPLSLDAVASFGRRYGYLCIAVFALILTTALLFSTEGLAFGLGMGGLYSGVCFLFGGYASQVQKAEAAHDQNQRTYRELQSAHLQLQGLVDQKASLAVEHERNQMARDLHDSVTQTVFSMNLAAQSARLLWDQAPSRAAGQLLRLEELAANALSEIQSLVLELKPRSIPEESLPAALHRLAEDRRSRDGLQVSLETHGEITLSEAETLGLHSIAQEALTNVVKHSGAPQAVIRLSLDERGACLEIEDHGTGFDPQAGSSQGGHFGLAAMSERAEEIGWSLAVKSQRGQGTRIRVTRDQPHSPVRIAPGEQVQAGMPGVPE